MLNNLKNLFIKLCLINILIMKFDIIENVSANLSFINSTFFHQKSNKITCSNFSQFKQLNLSHFQNVFNLEIVFIPLKPLKLDSCFRHLFENSILIPKYITIYNIESIKSNEIIFSILHTNDDEGFYITIKDSYISFLDNDHGQDNTSAFLFSTHRVIISLRFERVTFMTPIPGGFLLNNMINLRFNYCKFNENLTSFITESDKPLTIYHLEVANSPIKFDSMKYRNLNVYKLTFFNSQIDNIEYLLLHGNTQNLNIVYMNGFNKNWNMKWMKNINSNVYFDFENFDKRKFNLANIKYLEFLNEDETFLNDDSFCEFKDFPHNL